MTKLDERVSLELEMDLMALFSEDTPCEVNVHDKQPHYHAGAGEWYMMCAPCLHCGQDEDVLLICDKFKQILEQFRETANVPCDICHKTRMIKDIVIRFEKKGTK